MATNPPKRPAPPPTSSVIEWLLDSDPSIRWQVLRDLTGAPAEEVAAERARVATEGAGARLLALQAADGRVGRRGVEPRVGLHHARPDRCCARLGLDPASDRGAARGGPRPRPRDVADGTGRPWRGDATAIPSSRARSSRASTGRWRRPAPTSARTSSGIVDRLLAEQLPDGGWNCEAEQRLDAVVVQHHDLRARSPARIRTGRREQRRR